MEIKAKKQDLSLEYPKSKNIDNTKLSIFLPDVWLKAGITSVVFGIVMTNKVFSSSVTYIDAPAGIVPDIPIDKEPMFSYTELGLLAIFIISVLSFIIAKFKLRKNKENKKIKKIKNIFLILSIISLLIFIICKIIVI